MYRIRKPAINVKEVINTNMKWRQSFSVPPKQESREFTGQQKRLIEIMQNEVNFGCKHGAVAEIVGILSGVPKEKMAHKSAEEKIQVPYGSIFKLTKNGFGTSKGVLIMKIHSRTDGMIFVNIKGKVIDINGWKKKGVFKPATIEEVEKYLDAYEKMPEKLQHIYY